jgi:hypothetical protein
MNDFWQWYVGPSRPQDDPFFGCLMIGCCICLVLGYGTVIHHLRYVAGLENDEHLRDTMLGLQWPLLWAAISSLILPVALVWYPFWRLLTVINMIRVIVLFVYIARVTRLTNLRLSDNELDAFDDEVDPGSYDEEQS